MKSLAVRIVQALPYALISMIFSAGLVSVILLMADSYRVELIVPLSILLGGGLFSLMWSQGYHHSHIRLHVDIVAIVVALLWGSLNIFFTSQHLVTDRDPGTYAVGAAHLSQPGVQTMRFEGLEIQKGLPLTNDSAGFSTRRDGTSEIYAQGTHVLPAILGLMGRVVGVEGMLHLNVLIGMSALLMFYFFAAQLMRKEWALLAMGILGATLPFMYFSRDIYTEPLAAFFTFAALFLLHKAYHARTLTAWLLAGAVAGAGVLTRIDALLVVAALILYVAYALFTKASAVKPLLGFYISMLVVSTVGLLDIYLLSPIYFDDHKMLIFQEIILIAICTFVAATTLLMSRVRPTAVVGLRRRVAKFAYLSPIIIGLGFVLLASRPLWMQATQAVDNSVVYTVQQQTGLPNEPKRTYAELSMSWVSWYIGDAALLLGFVGISALSLLALRNEKYSYFSPAAIVFLVVGTIYFIKPSITPDQIWAVRRFLPVVTPLLILFAVFITSFLMSIIFRQVRRVYFKKTIYAFVSLSLLLVPLNISAPFLFKEENQRLGYIKSLCTQFKQNDLVVWAGTARYELVEPTKLFCGVESVGLTERLDDDVIMKIKNYAGGIGLRPIFGYYTSQYEGVIDPLSINELPSVDKSFKHPIIKIEQKLTNPPQRLVKQEIEVSIINLR